MLSVSIFAQSPVIRKCDPDDPIHGISKKMVFETIINTDLKQKELIGKTKHIFIGYRLLDPEKFNLEEINDSLVEFTLPFGFRQGLFYGKYVFGAGIVKAATYLFFDAIFSFNKEGQVKITFTNFRETSFFPINEKGYYGYKDDDPRMKDYLERYQMEMVSKSGVGKFLIWANTGFAGLAELSKSIKTMNDTLDKEFEMIDRVAASGAGEWVDNSSRMISLFSPSAMAGGGKQIINLAKERAENNYLFVVDNQRWKEHFEPILISFFSDVAKIINGSIFGIAQDGKILYENVNGKVLPTDTNERKKWEKEGKSL